MQDFDQFKEKARYANVVPIVDRLAADLLTPLAVYLKLSAHSSHSFLFESVEGGESLARYSFVGSDPHFVAKGNDKIIQITTDGRTTERPIAMIEFLRKHFGKYTVHIEDALPTFIGGAIGSLNFDCAGWFEPSLNDAGSSDDEADLMFFRDVVAFDHVRQSIQIISLVFTDEARADDLKLRELFDAAVDRNASIRTRLETAELKIPGPDVAYGAGTVSSNWEKSSFESAVRDVKELINAGDAYQVVISQCFTKNTNATPVDIYRAIRSMNPSPYMFLIRSGKRSIVGASPEMLVRVRGREMEYRPIAGTRPRGKTQESDSLLADEMKADIKEVAEHLMLVDLGRNDLGRVAEYGSVRVDSLMHVEKYSHVQHLVSYLSARLRSGLDRFDALASCFPAGTVSGAPKVGAMQVIRRLEPTPRGIYGGAVGYFDYAGNMDVCIAIRTMTLENGVARIQAGAGIVADSVPEAEFRETKDKARALLRALELAEATRGRDGTAE